MVTYRRIKRDPIPVADWLIEGNRDIIPLLSV